MIVLNKPVVVKNVNKSFHFLYYVKNNYSAYNQKFVFSARVGLSQIYKYLFNSFGPINVLVSPLTCYEALYPIIKNGHSIVFGDIDQNTLNLNEEAITNNHDVIQVIHLGGNPQNMNNIMNHCQINNKVLVEDCAQAFGAKYSGKLVGSFGDFSVFSLTKNLHALAGGLLLSKCKTEYLDEIASRPLSIGPKLYLTIKRILEQKSSYNNQVHYKIIYLLRKLRKLKENDDSIGSDLILSDDLLKDIFNQFEAFEEFILRRKLIANTIKSELKQSGLVFQKVNKLSEPVYTRLYAYHPYIENQEIIKKLRKNKIAANHISQDILSTKQPSVLEHPIYSKYFIKNTLPNYEQIINKLFAIPISPGLNEDEIAHICKEINNILSEY